MIDAENREITESVAADRLAPASNTEVIVFESKHKEAPGLVFLTLPAVYLLSALLGGLRLSETDNAFVFLKPELVCLVFAAVAFVLFFRTGVIELSGWISDRRTLLDNAAAAAVLICFFAATVQIFNSVLPERGLPFWVVGFCFFWSLGNSLLLGGDARRFVASFGAQLGVAFLVKYLVLANLTAPSGATWIQRIIENPGREAFTWLMDLPQYAKGTGYIQFFNLIVYLLGLYFTPRTAYK